MSERTATVTVNGAPFSCSAGTLLSDVLTRAGWESSPCGGHGRCGKCRVTASGALSPVTDEERRHLSADELAAGVRLACRVTVLGDCTAAFGDGAVRARAQILTDGELPPLTLRPAFAEDGAGAAVDIGTTTLAARLYDAHGTLIASASRLNPQSAFGADVVSRMEAALAGHADELADSVRCAVDALLREMAERTGKKPSAAVVTGNTVMLHLFTKTDVEPLTHAPFEVRRTFGETLPAAELGLASLAPDAPVYLPPIVASFVGADTATAMLAAGFCADVLPQTLLLTDVGTNGETVLAHAGKLYACSTAAGPAFEGAGISMGMGAAPGAVDRVTLTHDGKLAAHVIGDVAPAGICGSGLVDAVARLLDTEALDETGYLEDEPAEIAPPVTLTQADIRAVQLAKSAIHAGQRTLLALAGAPIGEVATLFVAGGFGSYLDVRSAVRIGLLPEELLTRVRVIGNAALTGASMLLLDTELRAVCLAAVRRTAHVELASNPTFSSEYMERMLF